MGEVGGGEQGLKSNECISLCLLVVWYSVSC